MNTDNLLTAGEAKNARNSSEGCDINSPQDVCSFEEDRQLIDNGSSGALKGGLALTSFNYINSIIGSGIVGIPYALRRVGFGMGIILLFTIAAVTDFSLCILVEAANAAGVSSYQELIRSQFGMAGYIFLTFIQFLYPYIAMVSYNIIIGDTITKVIRRFFGLTTADFFGNRIAISFFITLFITYPLSLLRAIVKLSLVSFISLSFAIAIMIFVIVRSLTMSGVIPHTDDAFMFFESGVTEAVGIIAFAYMCHHNSFLLYESLENATQERWNRVTHISMGFSCFVIVMFGISGYSIFSGFSQGDLLENFCLDDDLANVARIVFAITIMLTYPIECFVTREVCMHSVLRNHEAASTLITTGIVASAFAVSCVTDCLNIVLEINGVLAAVPLAYVLPAAAYIKVADGKLLSLKKGSAAVLATVGVLVAVTGLINIVLDVQEGFTCSHGAELPYCKEKQPNVSLPLQFNNISKEF